jgi:hypothetical protein
MKFMKQKVRKTVKKRRRNSEVCISNLDYEEVVSSPKLPEDKAVNNSDNFSDEIEDD